MQDSTPPDAQLQSLRAAAQGGSAEAWFRFGQALVLRQRVEEAHAWYLRAAEAGFGPAQLELARMQLHGIGTAQDVERAVAWLLRAEASGLPAAAVLLAMLGLGGAAMPRDGGIHARLLAAINAGHAPALRAGAIHFGRKPDAADQQRCMRMLNHAATQGDAVSAMLLAERLARGEGCAADPAAAERIRSALRQQGFAPLPDVSVPQVEGVTVAAGTLAPDDVFHQPPLRELSARPRVAVADGLLSTDECRLLIACAQPMLRRSQAIDPGSGLASAMQVRTSSDASFDPLVEDLALRMVQHRMASAAHMELVQAEHLVVLRYEPAQEYRPHRDYRPPQSLQDDIPGAGNRQRTICVYLNQPEEGGETEFPVPGVKVDPRPGRAVIFDNLDEDGRPDPDSLHAGLPVRRGEKWLATLWLRQGQYRRF